MNKTNFHMNGFAQGLALKQRRKATLAFVIRHGRSTTFIIGLRFGSKSIQAKSPAYFLIPGCQRFGPMGMSDGTIKESQLSVTSLNKISADKAGRGPYLAGLSGERFWSQAAGTPSMDRRQYLQIDFGGKVDMRLVSSQRRQLM